MLELLVIDMVEGHTLIPINKDNIAEMVEEFTCDQHYELICVMKDKTEMDKKEVKKLITKNKVNQLKEGQQYKVKCIKDCYSSTYPIVELFTKDKAYVLNIEKDRWTTKNNEHSNMTREYNHIFEVKNEEMIDWFTEYFEFVDWDYKEPIKEVPVSDSTIDTSEEPLEF